MVKLAVKNGLEKGTWYNKTKLCAQNVDMIMDSMLVN